MRGVREALVIRVNSPRSAPSGGPVCPVVRPDLRQDKSISGKKGQTLFRLGIEQLLLGCTAFRSLLHVQTKYWGRLST